MNPRLTDKEGWALTLLEHRRALFERVIAAFPEECAKKQSAVDIWRIRLRPATIKK